MKDGYNTFQYNLDGSKFFLNNYDSLELAQAAIALLDQSQSYSIEIWKDAQATVLQ